MGTVTAPAAWMPKSLHSHSRLFSPIRTTRSPALIPASISPDATASAWRSIAFQLSACQAPPTWWWTSVRSPYLAAWRRKTPSVVLSLTASGSRSCASARPAFTEDVALFDRLDRQRQRSGRHAHRHLVALLATDEGTSHGESTEIRPADGSLSTAPTRW